MGKNTSNPPGNPPPGVLSREVSSTSSLCTTPIPQLFSVEHVKLCEKPLKYQSIFTQNLQIGRELLENNEYWSSPSTTRNRITIRRLLHNAVVPSMGILDSSRYQCFKIEYDANISVVRATANLIENFRTNPNICPSSRMKLLEKLSTFEHIYHIDCSANFFITQADLVFWSGWKITSPYCSEHIFLSFDELEAKYPPIFGVSRRKVLFGYRSIQTTKENPGLCRITRIQFSKSIEFPNWIPSPLKLIVYKRLLVRNVQEELSRSEEDNNHDFEESLW